MSKNEKFHADISAPENNNHELSDDALENVSGGLTRTLRCPRCGQETNHFDVQDIGWNIKWQCKVCGEQQWYS